MEKGRLVGVMGFCGIHSNTLVNWVFTARWSHSGMEMLSADLENKLQLCLEVHCVCEHEEKSARKYREVLSCRG